MDLKSKIILIYGPTASGKSEFAIKLAKKIDGEIINADSMQVYKELKILTARPNKKEIIKNITLGRLETSEDFKISEKNQPAKESEIESLKISVRELTDEDIKERNLPNQTSGLVITEIAKDSPLINSIEVNSIILEAQKKKIKTVNDLNEAVSKVLKSNQQTILLVIYNSQNQRRYIGIKLN